MKCQKINAKPDPHTGLIDGGAQLIPPHYVVSFVKRSKNNCNDAEAISEAASCPSMPTVPVKTVDEQAVTIIVKHRGMLVGQRTQAINALRGHAAGFGIVGGQRLRQCLGAACCSGK